MFGLTKRTLKKRWLQTTNKIAYRAYLLLDNGQPNPDWIVARLRDEFPDATECQILTAVATEARNMITLFVRANCRSIDQALNAAIDDWSNTLYASENDNYIRLYWPVLRLARSIYYEELMSRDYGGYAENAARTVLQMWGDTFETGPSSQEKLQDSHGAVIRYPPVRIETIIMAFKILFRYNQKNKEFQEYLRKGILLIPFRYELNEEETQQLFKAWDNFVANPEASIR
jgi:hypothetical protein